MKAVKWCLAIVLLSLALLTGLPRAMRAQETNRAAVVVRQSDESMLAACIEFTEPEISGLESLLRSGLETELDVQGLGAAVCRIGQTGCPADDCWCQCRGGGDCIYWSYWHMQDSGWQYAQAGSGQYMLRDGDIDGWSWGPGAVNEAIAPPDVSFSDVCTDAVVESDTATPSATPITFVLQATSTTAANSAAATAVPTASSTAVAPGTATATAVPTNTTAPLNTAPPLPSATTEARAADAAAAEPALPTAQNTALPQNNVEALDPREETPAPPSSPVQTAPPPTAGPAQVVAQTQPLGATRIGDSENKIAAAPTAEPAPRLTIVGAAVQAPDRRAAEAEAAPQSEQDSAENSSSLFSYAIFGLIVLCLGGLLLLSSVRKK